MTAACGATQEAVPAVNVPPADGAPLATDSDDETALAAKVTDSLGHRGFTLNSLVTFMRKLPEAMPQFEPEKTRTCDVVWAVVIPETAEKGCAYADTMSGGARLLPNKMVSHNWGNLFAHLVAAIFADALGETQFWQVAHLLRCPEGLDLLEARLKDKGALKLVYWLCIFCVNQHVSICGATWGGKDSVTGEPYAACSCGKEKYTSGARCEMNKFDPMIALFKELQPGYKHLIAGDSKLVLFTRIWVIAEVAEAFRQSIPCAVQFFCSNNKLLMQSVVGLEVRKAQASRPEDVEFVLSKIDDKDEFDRLARLSIMKPCYLGLAEGMSRVMKENVDKNGTSNDHEEYFLESFNMQVFNDDLQRAEDCKEACDIYEKSSLYSLIDEIDRETLGMYSVSVEMIKAMTLSDEDLIIAATRFVESMNPDREQQSDEKIKFKLAVMRLRSFEAQVPVWVGSFELESRLKSRPAHLSVVVAKGGPELMSKLREVSQKIAKKKSDEIETVARYKWCMYGASILYFYCPDSNASEICLYRGCDETKPYGGSLDSAGELHEFILANGMPTFGPLSELNRVYYCEKMENGKVLVLAVFDSSAPGGIRSQAKQNAAAFQQVAAKLPDWTFAYLDPDLYYGSFDDQHGLRKFLNPVTELEPSLLVFKADSDFFSDQPNERLRLRMVGKEFSAETIEKFLGDIAQDGTHKVVDDRIVFVEGADDEEEKFEFQADFLKGALMEKELGSLF